MFQPYGNELARLLIERHFDVPGMEVWLSSSYSNSDGYEVDINSIMGSINGFLFEIKYDMRQHRRDYQRYNSSGYSAFRVNGIELISSSYYDEDIYNPRINVYDDKHLVKSLSSQFDNPYMKEQNQDRENNKPAVIQTSNEGEKEFEWYYHNKEYIPDNIDYDYTEDELKYAHNSKTFFKAFV